MEERCRVVGNPQADFANPTYKDFVNLLIGKLLAF
jgi:hypothetical protein